MDDRLRKFVAVVDAGSYTKAAQQLHISQPALSTALSKLERELGTALLARDKQPLALTKAGEIAYAHAKKLEAHNSNLKLQLTQLKNEKPLVRIGMIDSIAHTLLVVGEQLPPLEAQVRVSLEVNNSRLLLQALLADELDVVFAAIHHAPPKNMHAIMLGNEPLIGVTHPDRLQGATAALANGILPDYIGYDHQSRTSNLIYEHFARQGIEPQAVLHSTSPEIILHMVRTGRGTAVLPYMLVAPYLQRGELRAITPPISRPIAALRRRGKTMPTAIDSLNAATRAMLATQYAQIKAGTP